MVGITSNLIQLQSSLRAVAGNGKVKEMILFCPDLVGKEEVKAMMVGHGDFVRPVLNPCIKKKCVAYKDGKCMKYDNEVEAKE